MCGIVALIRQGGVEPDLITRLTEGVAHRGPDGQGVRFFQCGKVALGHRRLAILDLSPSGLQPMSDPSGAVWITYNGEIFNFKELRRDLERTGYKFRSQTDTEVLIALYMREGMRLLSRLRGMYAFLLHDTRTGETFYARDPIGIKPLYYRNLPDGIAFASEPGVLGLLGSNTLDLLPVIRSLMFLYPAGDNFGIREIRRVRPGGIGRISPRGELQTLPSGQILPDGRGPSSNDPYPDLEEFEDELRRSVREHLVSDVPVGLAFSGGLDSSMIAKLALDEGIESLRLYSFMTPFASQEDRLDQNETIVRAAEHLGTTVCPVGLTMEFLADLDQVVRSIGEPVADPAAIAFLEIARRAREEGRFVLLSGHGADELLGGYRRHRAIANLFIPALGNVMSLGTRFMGGDLRRLGEVFREPRRYWLCLLPGVLQPCNLGEIIASDCIPGLEELLEPLMGIASRSEGAPFLRRSMDLDFRSYLPDQNLNYLDKVSMAHGVEGRVPYLTPPVLSACAVLPEKEILRGKRGKIYLRKTAQRVLPAETGPKRGFGLPLKNLVSGDWKKIRERLTDPSSPCRFLWNPRFLKKLASTPRPPLPARIVYSMLVIDRWFREWRLN